MPHSSPFSFDPIEIVGAAFSLPLVSLAIAMLVAGGVLVVASRPRGDRASTELSDAASLSIRTRYAPEHRALGIAAIAVIALFAVENVVRGYVLTGVGLVWWWRFATPVFFALVGLSVILGLIATRGTTPPEAPVAPAARRTWMSFGPRPGLIGAGVTLLLLSATTVAAGLASSPDREGRYVWLEIPIANEAAVDPIRLGFYGWAYGVPVLICLAGLAAVTWALLERNAARPYIRPETVAAERDARREVASGAVRIATAGMLLTLAGAWRLIAGAGSTSSLVIIGENDAAPYEVAWRYAEFAVAGGWLAPALEIIACVLLLLVAGRLSRPSAAGSPSGRAELESGVEALL